MKYKHLNTIFLEMYLSDLQKITTNDHFLIKDET